MWLSEKKEELDKEYPDLSEADLMVTAAKAFKELTKEEKQVEHRPCVNNFMETSYRSLFLWVSNLYRIYGMLQS